MENRFLNDNRERVDYIRGFEELITYKIPQTSKEKLESQKSQTISIDPSFLHKIIPSIKTN